MDQVDSSLSLSTVSWWDTVFEMGFLLTHVCSILQMFITLPTVSSSNQYF